MNLENLNVVELDAQGTISVDGGFWRPGVYESWTMMDNVSSHVFSGVIGFLAGVHDGLEEAFND